MGKAKEEVSKQYGAGDILTSKGEQEIEMRQKIMRGLRKGIKLKMLQQAENPCI